jgi:hypothetical protein
VIVTLGAVHKRSKTSKNRKQGWAGPPEGQNPFIDFVLGHRGTKAKLEKELGRPICGFRVGGVCCRLDPGHENPLHSGDYKVAGLDDR